SACRKTRQRVRLRRPAITALRSNCCPMRSPLSPARTNGPNRAALPCTLSTMRNKSLATA
ncbi:MAG: hypothetical protein J4G18_04415, partial [Anaerolineae bacterium]|nr:hypothetical protein [Anaerolineae bacterium]